MKAPASGSGLSAPACRLEPIPWCAGSNARSFTSPELRRIVVYVRTYSSTASFSAGPGTRPGPCSAGARPARWASSPAIELAHEAAGLGLAQEAVVVELVRTRRRRTGLGGRGFLQHGRERGIGEVGHLRDRAEGDVLPGRGGDLLIV